MTGSYHLSLYQIYSTLSFMGFDWNIGRSASDRVLKIAFDTKRTLAEFWILIKKKILTVISRCNKCSFAIGKLRNNISRIIIRQTNTE